MSSVSFNVSALCTCMYFMCSSFLLLVLSLPCPCTYDISLQVKILNWLLNHLPDSRPTCHELLKSDFLPPPHMEESECNQMIRKTIRSTHSRAHRLLVETIFSQPVQAVTEFGYDVEAYKVCLSVCLSHSLYIKAVAPSTESISIMLVSLFWTSKLPAVYFNAKIVCSKWLGRYHDVITVADYNVIPVADYNVVPVADYNVIPVADYNVIPRVQDYLDSKRRYRNDVIMSLRFWVITSKNVMPPLHFFYHAKLLTLNLCIRICYSQFSTMTITAVVIVIVENCE